MKFAVIGGDMRTVLLCSLLGADGHEVRAYALEECTDIDARLCQSASAAAEGADCVILPLPACGKPGQLNAPFSAAPVDVCALLEEIPGNIPICAGRVDPLLAEAAAQRHGPLVDYFAREELAVLNAAVTAEGALEVLMKNTPRTVFGSRVLVIGFGRIGKLLAHRLRALGAAVSVSSRSYGDMAWCRSYGYGVLDTRALDGTLGDFDAVINTVPALILDETLLGQMKPGALCVDLASRPGGVDLDAAAQRGITTVWALSLPGKTAPASAGEVIRDTIYNIMGELKNG